MFGLIVYGIKQNKQNNSVNDYFLAGNNMSWKTAMFSSIFGFHFQKHHFEYGISNSNENITVYVPKVLFFGKPCNLC